jgi:hypothetical protein
LVLGTVVLLFWRWSITEQKCRKCLTRRPIQTRSLVSFWSRTIYTAHAKTPILEWPTLQQEKSYLPWHYHPT